MSSILEMLTSQLGGVMTTQIGQQLGMNEEATKSAMPEALGLLLGALAGNTRRSEGAEALSNALAKDHDGSILDDVGGFLANFQQGSGEGILRHVLGTKRSAVEERMSKSTNLDAATIGKLLTMLAPIVLGALGKTQRSEGLNAQGLAGLLQTERKQAASASPQAASIVSMLLDADGDGDVTDDVAKMGMGLLGKLLGRGKK